MNAPISRMRQKRSDLVLILVTAVLFSFAINLITSYLSAIASNDNAAKSAIWLLWLGLAFLLGAGLVLKRIIFDTPIEVLRLRGAVAFKTNKETVEPVEISGYSFNDDFCEYLKAFLQENKAYWKLFSESKKEFTRVERFNPDELSYHTIMNSVLEFVVLHQLDLHLNSYFVENEINDTHIITLTRDQVDPSVLKNRVIDLITKDMKERPAFVRDSKAPSEGIICYAGGEDGAVFQRLDVELPPKSKIYRNSDGFLVIANPFFELVIKPQFEGFCTNVSRALTTLSPTRLITIKIETQIKPKLFASTETMEMYAWLDSFLERMEDYVSTDKLEQRLNTDLIEILKPSKIVRPSVDTSN
jgi:hypothetical protein